MMRLIFASPEYCYITTAIVTIHAGVQTIYEMTFLLTKTNEQDYMDRVKRIWYLSPMRAAKVQVSLRIRAVSPEPSLLAHTSSESRGTFRQKARSLAPLNGWACAVKICHDGMLEDTNSLDGAHITFSSFIQIFFILFSLVTLHFKIKLHKRCYSIIWQ